MLVGRDTERQVLERLVAGARVGQSGVLVVTGEPGIGKTQLLGHAADLASDMSVLRAAGSRTEAEVAFAGLSQVLRPVLGLIDAIPEPQARALEVALALRAGEPGDRFAVGAAALSLLSRHAEDTPLIVLVDDAHELDRPSAEALVFVARRLIADCAAIVFAARSEPASVITAASFPELALAGLDIEAAGRLLAASGLALAHAGQLARLHDATGGNPLAMIELASDVETWMRASPQAPLPVPTAVAHSFARRAGELEENARVVLLAAAIADGDLALLSRVCAELDVELTALAAAEALDLVRITPDHAEFRHPLVRSSVYGSAPPALRRRVHRAVAAALPEHDVERRAWNLAEAAVGPDSGVADLLEHAGGRARARSAYAVAATAYDRAASLTADARDRARRLVTGARCAWLAGETGRAGELLDLARDLRPTPELEARIWELRAAIAARTGSLDDARRILTAAVATIEASDVDSALIMLADALHVCFYMGDARSAQALVETTDRLLPASRSAAAGVLAHIAAGIAQVLAGQGGIERLRLAVGQLASSDGVESYFSDDPLRRAWLVLGPLFLRESQTGRELARRVVDEYRERTALGSLPFLLFHTARDNATTDRWAAADADYHESIRLARETGQTTDLAMSLAGLAWLQARTGQEAECKANAAEATQLGEIHHIHLAVVWAGWALAESSLGAGAATAAMEQLQQLAGTLDGLGIRDADLSPAPELVDALLRTGDAAQARVVAGRYEAVAAEKGQPWAMARAARAIGSTCDPERVDDHFQRALRLHEATTDIFELARTRLAYGARLRRGRRRVDARPQLRAALEAFERLGARPWADFAARELTATGETAFRSGDSRRQLLTAQELQIGLLLAEGRTTKQVAAGLFLSPKTVEYHLRSVYAKLGVRSRAELAAALTPD